MSRICLSWLFLGASVWAQYNEHPRIYLTPPLLTEVRAAAASSGDPNHKVWRALKEEADTHLRAEVLAFPIADISNGNPARVTVRRRPSQKGLPKWQGGAPVLIGGGAGSWAALNTDPPKGGRVREARWVDETHFDLAFDTTALGSYAGQNMSFFFRDLAPGGWISFSWQGSGWMSAAQTLGLAYAVTRDGPYADKALELLDAMSSSYASAETNPCIVDGGYATRTVLPALAFIYDWVYGYEKLTPERKKAAEAAVLTCWDYAYRKKYFFGGYGVQGVGLQDNYSSGAMLGFGLAALAMGDNNRAVEEINEYWVRRWNREFRGLLTPPWGVFAGGYSPEGSNYGQNAEGRYLHFALAQKSARNLDLGLADMARRFLEHRMYALNPDLRSIWSSGGGGSCTGAIGRASSVLYPYVLGDTQEAKYGQWMNQNTTDACGQSVDRLDMLLYDRPSRPAADYRPLLSQRMSPGSDGMYTYKSDGSANALQVRFFAASRWLSGSMHSQKISGHLDIMRGSDWLLPLMGLWRGGNPNQPGFTGPDNQGFDMYQSAAYNNVMCFDDKGEYLSPNWPYVCGWISIDQSYVVPETKVSPTYAYIWTNFTRLMDMPYDDEDKTQGPKPALRTVRHYSRGMVNFLDGVVVVVDRLKKRKAEHTAAVQWATNEFAQTSLEGTTWTSTLRGSRLWSSSRAPGGLTASIKPLMTKAGTVNSRQVVISDPNPGTTFQPITGFYAGSTKETASDGKVESDVQHFGMVVHAGKEPHVVVYSTDLVEQSDGYRNNLITRYEKVPFRFEGGAGKCVVLDLARGEYAYSQDGQGKGSVVVDGDGTAYFPCSGGAWTLTRTGSVGMAIDAAAEAPEAVQGSYYNYPLCYSGGTEKARWSLASGELPPGLRVEAGGALAGTPGATGTFRFTLRLADGEVQAQRVITLVVLAP